MSNEEQLSGTKRPAEADENTSKRACLLDGSAAPGEDAGKTLEQRIMDACRPPPPELPPRERRKPRQTDEADARIDWLRPIFQILTGSLPEEPIGLDAWKRLVMEVLNRCRGDERLAALKALGDAACRYARQGNMPVSDLESFARSALHHRYQTMVDMEFAIAVLYLCARTCERGPWHDATAALENLQVRVRGGHLWLGHKSYGLYEEPEAGEFLDQVLRMLYADETTRKWVGWAVVHKIRHREWAGFEGKEPVTFKDE